jgi:diguanylate cyclase (GGDEF)-like protein/PAS domain S-box-containing protein
MLRNGPEVRADPAYQIMRTRFVQLALIAIVYALGAYLVLRYGRASGVAAAIWPLSALALGVLVMLRRLNGAPEIAAIALANAAAHYAVGDSFWISVVLGLANGLCVGGTAWLMLQANVTREAPTRIRTVVGLVAASALGPVLGSILGGMALGHEWSQAPARLIFSWWLVDAVSFVILLPPFLFWRSEEQRAAAAEFRRRTAGESSTRARLLEMAAASLTLALAALLVPITGHLVLIELSATALLWFALRFGMFYTAGAAAGFSVCVVTVALLGYWPGSGEAARTSILLQLQGTLALTTLPALLIAAIMSQREHARRALHEDALRLAYALDGANDGLWDWHLPSGANFFSVRASRMFGYTPEEFSSRAHWSQLVHPDDLGAAQAAFDAHVAGETPFYEAEIRCRHRDGRWIWIHDRGKVVERDPDGTAIRAVGTYADISDRKRLEKALEHMATHDALTGLANRSAFERGLRRAGARLERQGGRVAAILIDVDHFKAVNDGFGHGAGDALLATMATRLRATVRDGDLVARLGGDEFAVVASGQSAAEFDLLASRLCAALSEPLIGSNFSIRPSVSLGIAVASSATQVGEELVARADRALYAAKSAGRGTWRSNAGADKVA